MAVCSEIHTKHVQGCW